MFSVHRPTVAALMTLGSDLSAAAAPGEAGVQVEGKEEEEEEGLQAQVCVTSSPTMGAVLEWL